MAALSRKALPLLSFVAFAFLIVTFQNLNIFAIVSDPPSSHGDNNNIINEDIYFQALTKKVTQEQEINERIVTDSRGAEGKFTFTYRRSIPEPRYPNVFQYDEEGIRYLIKRGPRTTGRASKELVLSSPELFEKIPNRFLSNFKNPCWIREETELNCLPYFYIIGMYKCATTDIWDKLVRHPEVAKPAKEPHWWGPRRHGWTKKHCHHDQVVLTQNVTGGLDDSSLEWYLNFYKQVATPAVAENTIKKGNQLYHPTIFGDASISTAFSLGLKWTDLFKTAEEPPYTNADLIAALQPNAKIILMVRNPTKRAISWWWFNQNSKEKLKSAKDLHEGMVGYIDCFNSCLEVHNLRYCAYASGCPYDLLPNLQVGIYHVFLQDWIKAFSRDSVLVIRLEDWQADTEQVYNKLLDFLGLERLDSATLKKILGRDMKNTHRREHDEAWPETVQLLDDFYSPYNKEFAKLMGNDKFLFS